MSIILVKQLQNISPKLNAFPDVLYASQTNCLVRCNLHFLNQLPCQMYCILSKSTALSDVLHAS
jgi:hypothetical protein